VHTKSKIPQSLFILILHHLKKGGRNMMGLFKRKGQSGRTSPSASGVLGGSSQQSPKEQTSSPVYKEEGEGSGTFPDLSLAAMIEAGKKQLLAQNGTSPRNTIPPQQQRRETSTGEGTSRSGGAGLGYGFHSSALQIKDAEKSLQFYQEILGMELIKHTEAEGEYSMYFLSFPNLASRSEMGTRRDSGMLDEDIFFGSRQGMLQLIHVHGSENDASFRISNDGPGFTHFSVSVPDVEQAKNRMETLGVTIVEDGSNARGFAAVADPDGYHIQLISQTQGKDDRLREQLAQLMSEPISNINHINAFPSSTTKSTSTTFQQLGTSPTTQSTSFAQAVQEQHERNQIAEKLRNARGGSPVSPSSPL
jgi:lactoylglutathione lyase